MDVADRTCGLCGRPFCSKASLKRHRNKSVSCAVEYRSIHPGVAYLTRGVPERRK